MWKKHRQDLRGCWPVTLWWKHFALDSDWFLQGYHYVGYMYLITYGGFKIYYLPSSRVATIHGFPHVVNLQLGNNAKYRWLLHLQLMTENMIITTRQYPMVYIEWQCMRCQHVYQCVGRQFFIKEQLSSFTLSSQCELSQSEKFSTFMCIKATTMRCYQQKASEKTMPCPVAAWHSGRSREQNSIWNSFPAGQTQISSQCLLSPASNL